MSAESHPDPEDRGAAGLRVYRPLVRRPRSALVLTSAFVARLPGAMAPIGLILYVAAVRGSFGDAGAVVAVLGVGAAVGSPVLGRMLDRHGPRRVVVGSGLAAAALLSGLTFAVTELPLLPLLLLAGVTGAVLPPIAPAFRAGVRALFAGSAHRRAGYALDSVSVEAVYVVGPLLLSALVLLDDRAPLLATAGLLAAGSVAFGIAVPPDAEPAVAAGGLPRRRLHVLRSRTGLVVALGGAVGITFGIMDTSMAGAAVLVLQDESKVGLLFAATAGGSVLGGLVYGTRPGPPQERGRLRGLLVAFAGTLAVVALLTTAQDVSALLLMAVLFGCGLTIAPLMIVLANLVDSSSPAGSLSEGQAWNATATATGMAAGTALAGQLVDSAGIAVSLGAGAAVVALVAVAAWTVLPATAPTGRPVPAGGGMAAQDG